MAISIYDIAVPVFRQHLDALDAIIDKLAAHAAARKIEPSVFLTARLYPDMFAFTRQVQIATDAAKGAAARLSGQAIPSYPDTETTIPELKERIAKTLAYVGSINPEQMQGADTKRLTIKIGPNELELTGLDFLLHHALPNFFFHCTTAYDILRHNGLEIGKRDYMRRQ
jgi:uncharacterized protein